MNPIDFGEYRDYSFYKGVKKIFLYIKAYGVKLLKVFYVFDWAQI